MKATEWYLPVVLFIILYKMVLNLWMKSSSGRIEKNANMVLFVSIYFENEIWALRHVSNLF